MILKWNAAWYELDQTIIVGDKDWFYLPSDENNHSFFNELYQSNSFIRKKLLIEKISHPILGGVRGIVAIGLDYTIYLTDGTVKISSVILKKLVSRSFSVSGSLSACILSSRNERFGMQPDPRFIMCLLRFQTFALVVIIGTDTAVCSHAELLFLSRLRFYCFDCHCFTSLSVSYINSDSVIFQVISVISPRTSERMSAGSDRLICRIRQM